MMGLRRSLSIWLGSFLLAAAFLIIYWHIPLGPLVLGGVATLVGTCLRYYWNRRASRP